MSKIKLLYISIIGLFLITQSCKRDNTDSGCPSYTTNYQSLSIGAINQTPYFTNPAFDTISFASDKGDTITFVKTKTDTSWYCENDNSNADCPKENANCYQVLHNIYTTSKGVGYFDVKHSLKNSNNYDRIEININTMYFSFYDRFIGSTTFGTYKNSITINNKLYFKAIKVYEAFEDVSTSSVYLNKDYGIIQLFDIKTNTFWYLLK